MHFLLFASFVTLLTCFVIVAGRLVHVNQPLRGSFRSNALTTNAFSENRPGGKQFPATAIESKGITCPAVRDLIDIRMLDEIDALPNLPVIGCAMEHCNCRYVHYADRRDRGRDRRIPVSLQSQIFHRSGQTDQRLAGCGRRASDLDLLVFQT
jgi:hypothetical protein